MDVTSPGSSSRSEGDARALAVVQGDGSEGEEDEFTLKAGPRALNLGPLDPEGSQADVAAVKVESTQGQAAVAGALCVPMKSKRQC